MDVDEFPVALKVCKTLLEPSDNELDSGRDEPDAETAADVIRLSADCTNAASLRLPMTNCEERLLWRTSTPIEPTPPPSSDDSFDKLRDTAGERSPEEERPEEDLGGAALGMAIGLDFGADRPTLPSRSVAPSVAVPDSSEDDRNDGGLLPK